MPASLEVYVEVKSSEVISDTGIVVVKANDGSSVFGDSLIPISSLSLDSSVTVCLKGGVDVCCTWTDPVRELTVEAKSEVDTLASSVSTTVEAVPSVSSVIPLPSVVSV